MSAAVTSMSVTASHCRTIHRGCSRRTILTDLLTEDAGVREEQRRLPPVDHDALRLLGLRVAAHVVPALEPRDVTEDLAVRPPVPAEEQQDREGDRDEDALEHAEEDHADRRDERERQRRLADARVAAQDRRRPPADSAAAITTAASAVCGRSASSDGRNRSSATTARRPPGRSPGSWSRTAPRRRSASR